MDLCQVLAVHCWLTDLFVVKSGTLLFCFAFDFVVAHFLLILVSIFCFWPTKVAALVFGMSFPALTTSWDVAHTHTLVLSPICMPPLPTSTSLLTWLKTPTSTRPRLVYLPCLTCLSPASGDSGQKVKAVSPLAFPGFSWLFLSLGGWVVVGSKFNLLGISISTEACIISWPSLCKFARKWRCCLCPTFSTLSTPLWYRKSGSTSFFVLTHNHNNWIVAVWCAKAANTN